MTKITVSSLCFISVIIALFAIYGGCQLYTRSDRLDIVEAQKAEIANLELKVRELRRINNLVLILEQILNPCQIDELKAANAQIEQKKWREYERYEIPILNEKERERN